MRTRTLFFVPFFVGYSAWVDAGLPIDAAHSPFQRRSITLFSCPKGPRFDATWHNENLALHSWLSMSPPLDYVVLIAEGTDLDHVAHDANRQAKGGTRVLLARMQASDWVDRSIAVAPSIGAIFRLGELTSPHARAEDLFIYVNSDIMLPVDMVGVSLAAIATQPSNDEARVVLAGWRIDCEPMANKSAVDELLEGGKALDPLKVIQKWRRCWFPGGVSKDYWIFTRGFWSRPEMGGIEVPDFAIGRLYWDSYLTAVANRFGLLIDLSPVAVALHWNHDYMHASKDGSPTHADNSSLDNMGKLAYASAQRLGGWISAYKEMIVSPGGKYNLRLMQENAYKLGLLTNESANSSELPGMNLNHAPLRACPMQSCCGLVSSGASPSPPPCLQVQPKPPSFFVLHSKTLLPNLIKGGRCGAVRQQLACR